MGDAKVKIGIIGCGKISDVYFQAGRTFEILDIVACADLDRERAKAKATLHAIPYVYSVEELLADPDIEIVVNLTIPKAHAEITLQVMQAGKSVYSEKPLAMNRRDGQKILTAAHTRGVRVGGAPDTFLGGGIQTCRKLIDDGEIGIPIAATAFMLAHGPESWHPDPDFYYQPGGGPLFDMGPYYLTALVNLIGPIRRVTASTHVTFPERTITSAPHFGEIIHVNTPTHIAGVMDFATGAVGTLITSFDVWSSALPSIEIYGTEGTLSVPDPNTFGGPVRLRRAREKEWSTIPLTHSYSTQSRGIGVADMASAMRSKRLHRANEEITYHIVDVMQAFLESSVEGKHIMIASTCACPAPLPLGLVQGQIDL
ncbi:MAG: Gfo/Idh/MocA family oxidoreductase [Ktedonobacteraceae bacterium]